MLNPTTFYVDIPMTNRTGDSLNYHVAIYPKNENIRGAVELFKRDGETGLPLPGVTFSLYTASDQLIQSDLVTNAEGYVRVNSLPYGNYYFIETAVPQDYVVKNVKYNFSIHDSGFVDIDGTRTGTVVELTIDNFKVPSIEKSVNDAVYKQQVIPGDVVTYNLLIGLPDDIKDYHSFVITDVLDDRLTFEGFWEVEGAPTSAFMFNETGQTLTWTVTDFNALDGVQFFVINFTASINGNADSTDIPNTATINFEDSTNTGGEKPSTPVYVEPVNGSITIEKTDAETGERLPGAMFELRRGATVIGTETTDSNGMITWGNLQDGNYTIVETNAPEGYRILTEPVSVTLNSANSSVVVSITNTKIGWELPETGGMGTIIFTITGMAFMGTGMMMYRRRKLLNRI